MKLPNGERAVIPEGKLADYCLSPLHPDGKHKAKVFEKALGITKEDSFQLQNLVLESAKYGEVRNEQKNEFGKRYIASNMRFQGSIKERYCVHYG